ncbi:YtcA family lipoprotein [Edaphobacter dinghuensis]|nr:YtcA family lipoprotein [Edaphobacter dinghuensis]
MSIKRFVAALGASVTVAGLSGCAFSPSINVLGSYFPAWIVCCAIAIGITTLMHYLFSRWKLVDQLWPLPFLYPCLISFVSCFLWLVFFR